MNSAASTTMRDGARVGSRLCSLDQGNIIMMDSVEEVMQVGGAIGTGLMRGGGELNRQGRLVLIIMVETGRNPNPELH
eukprot:CAMPEP_0172307084 /NCGR_PEP_ID=MMETSP1058-20130122/8011_1 /TAXON_ID=83371 /ORGANISM="Detonula confervacea, Strain CCMP 353" /LENGTH=77 /DNA_ID=CAMNT_0013019157 /DNA_START=523 /DNA_END=754 /DNA_ORIENTATION=-